MEYKHVIDIVVQGKQNATPALEQVAVAAGATEKAIQRLGATMSGRGGLAGDVGGFARLEKMRDQLMAMARAVPKSLAPGGMKDIFYDITNAKSSADLDRVGMKVAILTSKAEILGTLGGAGMRKFGQEVRNATSLSQLTALEQKIAAAGAAAQATGPKFTSMGDAIKQMASSFSGLSAGLQGMIGMFVGMAAFQGVMALVEGVKKLVMGTKELALEQRNVNIEALETGLSVTTLETYKVAAAETGVELGNLRMGMRMLATNMEKSPEAFKRLGIEVHNSAGEMQSLDIIMPQIMELFKGVTNETQRLELASVMFGGRMGARLIPLLVQGSEAMAKYKEEGVRLGVIMSDVSDRSLVNLARQTAVLDLAWKGMTNQLQLGLIPAFIYLTGIMSKLVTAMTWLGTGGRGFDENEKLKEKSRLWDEAFLAKMKYVGLYEALMTPTVIVEPTPPGMELASGHTTPQSRIGAMAQRYIEEARNLNQVAEAAARAAAAVEKALNERKAIDFAYNLSKGAASMDELKDAAERAAKFVKEVNESQGDLWRGVRPEDINPPKDKLAVLQQSVGRKAQLDRPGENAGDYLTQMKKAADAAFTVAELTKSGIDAIFSGLSSGLAATMEAMIRGTMNLKQGLDAIWRSILSAFFQMIAQMIAKALLFAAIKAILGIATGGTSWAAQQAYAASIPVPTGMSPAGLGMNAMGRTATNNTTTNVYNTIQTFSPRDVLMQYTSPSGVLRNAEMRLALQGEM